jgi:filamentous hemagglutinin family protein
MQGNRASSRANASSMRDQLLQGTSAAVVALILSATPAQAQLARSRAALGITPVIVTPQAGVAVRPLSQRQALARSLDHQVQIGNIRGAVLEAQRAAIAAVRRASLPTVRDGLTGADGSNADAGLDPVRGGVFAALDPTGINTWQGARLPTQVDSSGKPLVTIIQTDERAILTWNRFDVGANTTLNFEQKLNGVAQPGWIALNRVANSVAPSRILGSVTADGTVAVINSRGIIFEKGSQVNLRSLLVSSLDIGNFAVRKDVQIGVEPNGAPTLANRFVASTIADRNLSFLGAGLQTTAVEFVGGNDPQAVAPQLTSSLLSFAPITPGTKFESSPFLATPIEGAISFDRGATINAQGGGFIIATAPTITNAGVLGAVEGQVSLQAGRGIAYAISSGSATATDVSTGNSPDVRGIVLRSWYGLNGSVVNSGLIDVPRGYISLGSGEHGTITNAGLLSSTTSVARNAKISLTGGTVSLVGNPANTFASGIVVTPDTNGETVPIGTADAPPAFKTTKIEIGNLYLSRGVGDGSSGQVFGSVFGPAAVDFGSGSVLLAPNADVIVGGRYVDPDPGNLILQPPSLGSINVAAGAVIDVSGVKDLQLDASRNSLLIDPLKRNELRDTPNYREVTTDGAFTLNGATVYVDPRLSGVRADGVAWVGSPLIEAGSAASQIGVTAAELMTRGGNISMAVAVVDSQTAGQALSFVPPSKAPAINIAKGSTIDFSGGWVRYGEGFVRSSRLLTRDGRIVDIADADPNDEFIALGDGFTEIQSKFAISRTFGNALLQGGRLEAAYDEGRDAGTLDLMASQLELDGSLFGHAFVGGRQTLAGIRPTGSSTAANDLRKVQATTLELPSAGNLTIGSGYRIPAGLRLGADIVVYSGDRASVARSNAEILVSDAVLSSIGLSGVSLATTGQVTFAANSNVNLENGAALSIVAGRTITLDGQITAPSGRIIAETARNDSGSGFRTDDEFGAAYLSAASIPNLFDINVNGTLSVAGLWANDFGKLAGETVGNGYADGGGVRLTTAANVFGLFGTTPSAPQFSADLSGSINIADAARIDVSSGGYVAPDGTLDLSAKGGSVSLVNRTAYASPASVALDNSNLLTGTVALTPRPGQIQQIVPINPDSEVRFSVNSLKGFGFGGGGTFTLIAPEIAMGSDVASDGRGVGLDFFAKTGFGTVDLSANRSKIVPNLFRGVVGNSAFFDTTLFRVAAGQTLDLTQWVRSPFVDINTAARLTSVETGGDISFLLPVIPNSAFDRLPATLRLGGITELNVAAGGSITGSAGAQLVVSKLLNQGNIRIAGGSIIQQFSPEQQALAKDATFGVRDAVLGGGGLGDILGGGTGTGPYNENDLTRAALYSDLADTKRITNGDLFRTLDFDRTVYFLGQLNLDEGIRLDAGSVTDLSGTAILDPRAPILPNGTGQVTGRLVEGGTIQAGSIVLTQRRTSGSARGSSFVPQNLNALPGAIIDIRGASAAFDEALAPGVFQRLPHWSNGGRLSLLSGGTLGGAVINAAGGAAKAEGGVLEWLNPVIRQTDTGSRADNILFANQLSRANAGFDSLVVYDGFTADGDANLTVGKAFVVRSSDAAVANVASGAALTINAPFISLEQSNTLILADDRRPTITTGAASGSLTFNATQNVDLVGRLEFLLPTASVNPTIPRSSVNLKSDGDIRLVGLRNVASIAAGQQPSLLGGIGANGDINFSAGQIYATTGTGNLQREIEARQSGRLLTDSSAYTISSSAADGKISFLAQPGATASNAYSVGSHVRVRAAHIVQSGTLRTPLGLLELGSNVSDSAAPATKSLTLSAGSTTSVSGAGKVVPYGTTTDLTDYLFSPNAAQSLTAPPVGQLNLSGGTIDVAAGATVDGRGGGDIFAFEFVSGTGGSRDVLDRLNSDAFSGNSGLQYVDGRQVYAILPLDKADKIAKYDPVYSADYTGENGSLYSQGAGRSIFLDGGPGIAAGEYLLLPAHYALLPDVGALRVVENVGTAAPIPGTSASLLDGSVILGGSYATRGTGLVESTRRSFTLQTQDVIKRSSRLETTFGTSALVARAEKSGTTVPRLPIDAARVILSPLSDLKVAGLLDTSAPGGRGAQFDLNAAKIRITGAAGTIADPVIQTPGFLTLTADTLAGLNASSLFIGGERTDNKDGTTTLGVAASEIEVDGKVRYAAPELILAVAGLGSKLSIKDGAALAATGNGGAERTGDYIIGSTETPPDGNRFDLSGIGSVVRLSSGNERLIDRQGNFALRNTLRPSELAIGAVTIDANALALDTSRTFTISNDAQINATSIAISGDVLQFGNNFIESDVEAILSKAKRLTLRSPDVIRFSATVPHVFNNLRLDAPGLSLVAPLGAAARLPSKLSITAGSVVIGNNSEGLADCATIGVRACGRVGNSLLLSANDVTFKSGDFRTYGFDKSVVLNAANGMFVEGVGEFAVTADSASLALNTSFLIDRTNTADLRTAFVRPDYQFLTDGAFTMTSPAANVAAQAGMEAPGARIAIGTEDAPVASATINSALVRATSGIVDIRSTGSIALTGNSILATPGFTKTFGAKIDSVTVSANAGTVNLLSQTGSIDAGAGTSLVVDNGTGTAGTLNVIATRGTVSLAAALNPALTVGTMRTASLNIDAQKLTVGMSPFDLAAFVDQSGAKFSGDVVIRTGTGNLVMNAGQTLRVHSLLLTADDAAVGQGQITIAGTIDASGDDVTALSPADPRYSAARVNGGNITLYGNGGVTLAGSARLKTTTAGYSALDSRVASAGDVTLGVGRASTVSDPVAVTLATGAEINVSALRPGYRLVAQDSKDPVTFAATTVYRYAEADKGGDVRLRAFIALDNTINIRHSGNIVGAASLEIEAFKRFDLQAIAKLGTFAGISADGTRLDTSASGAKPNFFADLAPGTLPDFVRNLSVTARNGSSLAAFTVRPGIELTSTSDIILDSILNLGAGRITSYAAAEAAGLLEKSPLGPDAFGNARYQLVPNAPGNAFVNETKLFNQFVDMTYRVGGSVSGAAPVVTLRAAGDLDVKNSITDGFFTFHDRTNADYISYQLGGGDRTYNPAIFVSCGFQLPDCNGGVKYAGPGGTYFNPGTGRFQPTPILPLQVRFAIGRVQQGDVAAEFVHSPYSDIVNSVAALGTGDPLGVAELFPLVNGKPAASSSIQLVAGSGPLSVNPLHVDRSTVGSVLVSGERSYDVESTRGTQGYAGALQIRQPITPTNPELALFDAATFFDEKYGADAEEAKDFFTNFTWGNGTTGIDADVRRAAKAFFTNGSFVGPVNRETGINARFGDVVAFLDTARLAGGKTYAENVALKTPGYDAVAPSPGGLTNFLVRKIYTGTAVRTGSGDIALAGSGDVNLLRTEKPVYRTFTGVGGLAGANNAQVGSNAIYTAGVRSTSSLPSGVTIAPGQNEPIDYVPVRKVPNALGTPQNIAAGVAPIAPVHANDGGAISIHATGNVVGRRDVWGERFGLAWRAGQIGANTDITSLPEYFRSGIATLASGDVEIRAGQAVDDVTVALANNVFTQRFDNAPTLFALGSGGLALEAGGDLLGSRISIASGSGNVSVGGKITTTGDLYKVNNPIVIDRDYRNLLGLRLGDAKLTISASGTVDIGGISAFAVGNANQLNGFGYYSPTSSISVQSLDSINIVSNEIAQRFSNVNSTAIQDSFSNILPTSFNITSLYGDIELGRAFPTTLETSQLSDDYLLYPSEYGQLTLLSGGSLRDLSIAMLDADPADLPGAFSAFRAQSSGGRLVPSAGLAFEFPLDGISETQARLTFNRRATHLNDPVPARIFADGSIQNAYISLSKQARIGAGGNIVDLAYRGQNLNASDVTRITAGGDITTTSAVISNPSALALFGRAFNVSNDIAVGGPGALIVEAGRDLGPFLASGNGKSGGIRTIGNDANPWLAPQGASLTAMFGLRSPATGAANGADFVALRETYLNPANVARLDGDLFEQNIDSNGNKTPDSSRYVYAPILAQWLYDNEPALFSTLFASSTISDAAKATGGLTLAQATRLASDTGLEAAALTVATTQLTAAKTLADAAYPKLAELYAAFLTVGVGNVGDPARAALRQQAFLLDKLYFGELAAPADPAGNSAEQYVRSYRAIQTLFPVSGGYTDNLATYDIDPATGTAFKKLDAAGQPLVATRVRIGNADFRLSALQTTRGGNITLMGPGGDIIAGSVVRLSQQLARTAQGAPSNFLPGDGDEIKTFPIGNEGVLTLRGGGIRSFTDGDFRLNQSRLFAVRGGDLTLFSSNGDLNAGQGPKTSSSFPPITQRCDLNFFCEVDSAGSVAGAGIATFRPSPLIPASSVTLVAPVGTVDAGDAGVRASGNVFVAAARVANADNFKVGGASFGVPSIGVAAAAVPAGAANAINANTFRPQTLAEKINERLSQILVNVLGYVGGNNPCPEGQTQDSDGKCVVP